MEPVSLSAPVTVQVREYIAPTVGLATLALTLTEMGGSKRKTKMALFHVNVHYTHPPQ